MTKRKQAYFNTIVQQKDLRVKRWSFYFCKTYNFLGGGETKGSRKTAFCFFLKGLKNEDTDDTQYHHSAQHRNLNLEQSVDEAASMLTSTASVSTAQELVVR